MPGRSRYEGVPTATVQVADGDVVREVVHLLPRVPSDPDAVIALTRHRVQPDDRLDLISARYLGDPAAYWRICDANRALDPAELTGPDAEGSIIVVPTPGI
jgi:nucleoid-associated protein YgaU